MFRPVPLFLEIASRCNRDVRLISWSLLLLFSLVCTSSVGAQILTNGGFESGLGNWTSQLVNGGAATFINTPTNVHSGTNALLVTVSAVGSTSNAVRIVSSSFIAVSSDTYVLRFWANPSVLLANLNINLLGASPEYPQIPFQLSTNPVVTNALGNYQEYMYAFRATGTVAIAFNFRTAGQY